MKTSKVFKFAQTKYRSLLWKINRRIRKSIVVKIEQGYFSLPLQTDESINRNLFVKKEYERVLVSKVLSHLRQLNKCSPKGMGTVVDVGANNGVISIGLMVGGEFRKAIAIEPEITNFGLLEKNVKLNNLDDDIVCLNFARQYVDYSSLRLFIMPIIGLVAGMGLARMAINIPGILGADWRTGFVKTAVFSFIYCAIVVSAEYKELPNIYRKIVALWN